LRFGELARAEASHIQRGGLLVAKTKGKRVRKVPLPPHILAECPLEGKLIPWTERGAQAFARKVREESGVARFHTHIMRHTYARAWMIRGLSITGLQKVLGHKHIETTMVYAHFGEDMVDREAARLWAMQPHVQPLGETAGGQAS
jgi:integrase